MNVFGFLKSLVHPGNDILGIYRDVDRERQEQEDENTKLCATRPIEESGSYREGKI